MSNSVDTREAIARLRNFDEKLFVTAATNAIRRAIGAGRTRAADILKRSKIGQAVARRGVVRAKLAKRDGYFGAKPDRKTLGKIRKNVIPLVVKRSKLHERVDYSTGNRSWRGGLETSGFAALIEKGGRTKSHQIKPLRAEGYSRKRRERAAQLASAGRLTFQVGGRWVSPKVVTHPGSRIPRNPFIEQGAAHAESQLGEQLERGLAEAARKAGL